MKRLLKLGLGLLSTFPLLYYIYMIGRMLFDRDYTAMLEVGGEEYQHRFYESLFALEIVALVLVIGYLINVFLNRRVHRKGLWAILVFFGNILTIPVYWYLYIWRRPSGISSEQTTSNEV